MKASRLQDFLDLLRIAIVEYGPIRRSQTLLGSTVYSIEKPLTWANEQASHYQQQSETIAGQQNRLKKEFTEALTDVQAELRVKVKAIFANLSQSLDAFALDHWASSAEDLQKAWKARLEQYELNQQLETAATEAQAELEQRTKQTLEEIETELRLLANLKISSQKIRQVNHGFFEKNKELIALAGTFIGALALFPPLAPFALLLGGLGTVIGIFAGTLKSKHKRRSEAASHIHAQLAKQLNAHEEKVLEQTQQQIEKCSGAMAIAVDNYFQQLSDGLKQLSDCLQNTEASLRNTADKLNQAYAQRIMEYATGQTQTVRRVRRDFGKQIEIWPAKSGAAVVPLTRSVDELNRILQEKVVIH
jgi:biopolymer transport protein ExbB/TolQ